MKSNLIFCAPFVVISFCDAWTTMITTSTSQARREAVRSELFARHDDSSNEGHEAVRRDTLKRLAGLAISAIALPAFAEEAETIYEPKFIQQYEDFKELPSGVSYRDVNVGKGPEATKGDRVVYDWSGYTIGYFGRPFQAKGGPQVRTSICIYFKISCIPVSFLLTRVIREARSIKS